MSVREHLAALDRDMRFFSEEVSRELESAEPDIETLLDRYVEMRATSAIAMRGIAAAWLLRPEWRLDAVIERVENELRSRFAHVVPLDAIRVRGYRGIRLVLYEYLALHLGSPVSVQRLRALTGDQVHTERRLRELRDLGLRLDAVHSADAHHYVLESEDPEFDYASGALVKDIVNAVPSWSAARRQQVIATLTARLPQ